MLEELHRHHIHRSTCNVQVGIDRIVDDDDDNDRGRYLRYL